MIVPLAWASVALLGATALWAARPRPSRAGASARSFVVLRPCAGADPDLARNVASYPDAIVGVASRSDPAFAILPRAVITDARGPNYKADQLARLAAGRTEDAFVVADSDVDLLGVDLAALVGALDDADAAWCAPIEIAPETLGDRASAAILGASLHSFVLVAALDPRCLVGKLFAVRRDALERIGGFASLRQHLGEDMELARRLGRVVCVPGIAAPSRNRGRSGADVIARYARWLAVLRAQRPLLLVSYPFLFAPVVPLALALAAAPRALGPLLALAVVRLGTGLLARARSGARVPVKDFLLADALLLLAWLRALTTRTVTWRGRTLAVGARLREPGARIAGERR